MTDVRVGVVDVYVIRFRAKRARVLALRRGRRANTRSPGSWETVHGTIEPGERPPDAARREVREETGLEPDRLYSLTVNPFYLHRTGAVELAVAFAAVVPAGPVTLGDEHDAYEWLSFTRAAGRFTWPREVEALGHIRKLLRDGTAGVVEDVLRVL
ncbi:MAG TPA: NUDIX domain-containing protein [Gemmatimonadaceae bacterium]|nr:NUDIX domain-containing protein [Gemmatimonadaceae bacterium]